MADFVCHGPQRDSQCVQQVELDPPDLTQQSVATSGHCLLIVPHRHSDLMWADATDGVSADTPLTPSFEADPSFRLVEQLSCKPPVSPGLLSLLHHTLATLPARPPRHHPIKHGVLLSAPAACRRRCRRCRSVHS